MSSAPFIPSQHLGYLLDAPTPHWVSDLVRSYHGEARWALIIDTNEVLSTLGRIARNKPCPMVLELRRAGVLRLLITPTVAEEIPAKMASYSGRTGVPVDALQEAWGDIAPLVEVREPSPEMLADPRLEHVVRTDSDDLSTAALALELGLPVLSKDKVFDGVSEIDRMRQPELQPLREVARGEANLVVPMALLIGGGAEAGRALLAWFREQPAAKQFLIVAGVVSISVVARHQLKTILGRLLQDMVGGALYFGNRGLEQARPAARVIQERGFEVPAFLRRSVGSEDTGVQEEVE